MTQPDPDKVREALKRLDNLEKHMNTHGEFGVKPDEPWGVCREVARAWLTAQDTDKDFVRVPREPTPDMLGAIEKGEIYTASFSDAIERHERYKRIYRAMIAAAQEEK